MTTTWLVTGGAGFIGSCLVRVLLERRDRRVVVFDKLTYAGDERNLPEDAEGLTLVQGDLCDGTAVAEVFRAFHPTVVAHLAAETHVDRSIDGPAEFVRTNVLGTSVLLDVAREHWARDPERARQRFLHVSTDEVYGSIENGAFLESSPYRPSSPYAASKAGADHLVRAYRRTYGLPTLITNCSNNFGPRQFPEKLIPVMILRALSGLSLRLFGDGQHVRDWLFVRDHCRALDLIVEKGRLGETYNIGAGCEKTNRQLVEALCGVLDELAPRTDGSAHAGAVELVTDRPGHDRRYAVDWSKLKTELGWQPEVSFERGLRETVRWFIAEWRAGRFAGVVDHERRRGLAARSS